MLSLARDKDKIGIRPISQRSDAQTAELGKLKVCMVTRF